METLLKSLNFNVIYISMYYTWSSFIFYLDFATSPLEPGSGFSQCIVNILRLWRQWAVTGSWGEARSGVRSRAGTWLWADNTNDLQWHQQRADTRAAVILATLHLWTQAVHNDDWYLQSVKQTSNPVFYKALQSGLCRHFNVIQFVSEVWKWVWYE